ncbi:BMP family ABC transporter substrate-binding protein [Desulfothermus sp.]
MKRNVFYLFAIFLFFTATSYARDLKVGFIYVSPVGDAGYSYAHDLGRKEVAKLPGVKTYYLESIREGQDAERVLTNMARKGYDLIFATSYGYMDSVIKVAKRFPNVIFMHCSGFKRAKNVGTYFGRMYQARYLTGMVAGYMTKTNVLGYVAAYPLPELIRGINAFTLGAKSVNPKVVVRVVWTKSWYDPATEKEAAKSLLNVGADVITQHVDSPAPQEAAQEAHVYSIGYNSDMSKFAPNAHLTAAIWKWGNLYKKIVMEVKEHKWKSSNIWAGMDQGVVDIAPFGKMVPKNVRDEVMKIRDKIIKKEFVIFKGPIYDQNKKLRVKPGEKMTDTEIWSMNWFVDGVIGSTK